MPLKTQPKALLNIKTKIIKNILYLSVEDTGSGMSEEIKNYYLNSIEKL